MGEERKVEFFALSTCGWCKKTREWLDENQVVYDIVYVDQVTGDEREEAKNRILEFVSRLAFPVIPADVGIQMTILLGPRLGGGGAMEKSIRHDASR